MATVFLGNATPHGVYDELGDPAKDVVTTFTTHEVGPDGELDPRLSAASIIDAWAAHSPEPPTWVESDDPRIAARIAAEYDIPVTRPEVN